MGKFKNKLYGFFYGRYGTDKLNKVMLITYLVLLVIYTVLSMFVSSALFYLLSYLLMTALVITIFYRMFSRNIAKRRRENEKFCSFFRLRKNKFKDRKTHVYRKCRNCGAVLRLPRSKGKHPVVCPRCKTRFTVKG